jgi:hypothetical protein
MKPKARQFLFNYLEEKTNWLKYNWLCRVLFYTTQSVIEQKWNYEVKVSSLQTY